mmetsp:Transcript_38890/g.90474  ORF Transcript_38890/g.90474 Transcript_38890/m.90474 type:complete len:85 (-) Transcript_38890:232-486(-)
MSGFSSIVGGESNYVGSLGSHVTGEYGNEVRDDYNIILGGSKNLVYGTNNTIVGCLENECTGEHNLIAGGESNYAEKKARVFQL